MRKVLFGILMAAAAAVPTVAQAQDDDLREARREARAEQARERYQQAGERNQARFERRQERQEQRAERRQEGQAQRAERQQARQERVEAPVQQQQPQQSWAGRRGSDGQRSWSGGERGRRWSGGDRSSRGESFRDHIEATREASQRSAEQTIGGNYARQAQRNQQRYEERLREERREDRWDRDGRRDGGWDRDGRRDGGWSGRGDGRRGSWNRDWRRDNRYDWQRWRYANRSLFRPGGYYAPYRNYRYNRLSIGVVLDSLFYSNRYWLSDPWQYRLPPAPYGTQWVRYYDDVLLVDVYTGEVLDVIHDFFW